MIDLDHIESQFRAAVKEQPQFKQPKVETAVVITDLPRADAENLLTQVREFLKVLDSDSLVSWHILGVGDFQGVRGLLGKLEELRPDFVVSYRHLFEPEKELPHSLGTYIDMLTQATDIPVLLLPNPARPSFDKALTNTDRVLVVTDHIVGDHGLINWGLRLVELQGKLILSHIEDNRVFARFIDVISRLPDIPTDLARDQIKKQMLKEASEFLGKVKVAIETQHEKVKVDVVVRQGHTVKDFKEVCGEHEVDILVFNTNDKDQLAMAGRAYSMAVEMIDTPLLML